MAGKTPGKLTEEKRYTGDDCVSSNALGEHVHPLCRNQGSPDGSGLGLSIVQRIATLHQISVAFSNHPEGGFCVTLSG